MRLSRQNVTLLDPYVPGYQPDRTEKVVKLNTNENPYPPTPKVGEAIKTIDFDTLRLYPNPESEMLRAKLAEVYELKKEQVFCGNGCDEIISMLFRTFVEDHEAVVFPYPTYSYYKSAADIHEKRYKYVDTNADFTFNLEALKNYGAKMVILCNPNAPTGILLQPDVIEGFVKDYAGLVVVDETYIDFAGENASCCGLIDRYSNLLILRTLSKGYSLCGIRVGFAVGSPELIAELDKVRDSYNISYMNQVAAAAALTDTAYMKRNAGRIVNDREWLAEQLKTLGFSMPPSRGNFLFVTHAVLNAGMIYRELIKKRIFVRYFDDRRISNYLRITVGTQDELNELVGALREIIAEVRL